MSNIKKLQSKVTDVKCADINQRFWDGTINNQDKVLNVRVHSISTLIDRCKKTT